MSIVMCILHHIQLGDHKKEDEMVKACSTNGRCGKVTKILVGKPKERDHMGRQSIDGKIMLWNCNCVKLGYDDVE